MKDKLIIGNEKNILFYNDENGNTKVEVLLENEDVWLNTEALASLFNIDRSGIVRHINNIYKDEELDENSTCAKIAHVGNDDKQIYNTKYYNLDMIISIGFRVNSKKAIKFRTWANKIIKEYMIKGFTMDDERLKGNGGGNYLYSTAIDYDPKDEKTIEFFKIVQNKLHYATHGHTASEVIYERADSEKPFMGLTTFKGDIPVLQDVVIAKNYLNEEELKILNNLVSGYFDFAEIQAIRHNPMYMKDYIKQLDMILSSTGEKMLNGSGSISHKKAIQKAKAEYRKYQVKTISPVEEEYLNTIKEINNKIEKKEKNV